MRWLGGAWVGGVAAVALHAQVPELELPRPGAVVVTQVTGEVTLGTGEQPRRLKPDDRVRIGSTLTTGRKSLVTLLLSNGATLQIGSESELEIEEFGQAPFSESIKVVDLREEPTVSRTRLRLLRGDVLVEVKPLKLSRGSSFMLSTVAGTVRSGEGTFHAMVRMSDLGLGVCTVELEKGAADFEIVGAAFAPMRAGQKLAFAIEIDQPTGNARIGPMPKETAPAK